MGFRVSDGFRVGVLGLQAGGFSLQFPSSGPRWKSSMRMHAFAGNFDFATVDANPCMQIYADTVLHGGYGFVFLPVSAQIMRLCMHA